jgi:hypothetical protein
MASKPQPASQAKAAEPAKPVALRAREETYGVVSKSDKPARKAPSQAKGSEQEWAASRAKAKGKSSLQKAQAEARVKAAKNLREKEQRQKDEFSAKNILEKGDEVFNKYIEKPLFEQGAKAAKKAYSYLKQAGTYIGGDTEARSRLQSAR